MLIGLIIGVYLVVCDGVECVVYFDGDLFWCNIDVEFMLLLLFGLVLYWIKYMCVEIVDEMVIEKFIK